ncbi:ATP-dependent RNA helicase HrpA [Corynebacterium sp.]|uniref:ATP-dependent RNA helicase HrpA n=1 Tax=Corynebacterium sp. TaxID=1720 RepID=UPI0026DCA904|nr:ATP-dependent RNA helicase HrpA [Corynebacterium sp.]MDO5031696.1 ATP-dependent RNA helicase HrpA [Corynebacterium sp.]
MSDSTATPTREDLLAQLDTIPLASVHTFRRRLRKARSPHALGAINEDLQAAAARVSAIDEHVPPIEYPEQLPVTGRREDIAEAIRDNQVVIIAGETGSGKTTQIPKICLELGRGRRGLIGHTQPRRLAARTVAERIAEELGQDIGESVGYAIRFDDRVSQTTAVKLMTDGILLAEMQKDRFLNAYDTIIIDEAHERSLNIDFLLGYLKRLLPKRPDLKVIITSATIDPESFARHFAGADGKPAPIIEVSGRTYPVEIRYRPLEFEAGGKVVDQDPLDGLVEAIEELMAEGEGDILCFFPGERDIRDAMEAIEAKRWRGVEVTPLFSRLSNQEQHRVFSPHRGRRIVLSTNIAETSLTVPGIRYVVDTGTARISRYSTRTKVQRLPIEPISQASANQRSGRCGRVADGIAIRLYSEQDFASRPEFTDPEILRTNLASVILQMISLRLGDISEFPFVQAPEPKAVRDGLLLLHELGALNPEGKEKNGLPVLTDVGRHLARIPVDPRMSRMLVEAARLGCLEDVIVIVAAMTIQDVRERPLDFQAQADQTHARFKDKSSDYISMLKLWDYVTENREELSGNAFRKRMKKEFLHYMRIREWFDLVRQLKDVAKQLKWGVKEATERRADDIHMSLLSGLLSNIGARDGNSKEFIGARNTHFLIFPGSALAKKPPAFLMAAELVETSRLWARDVAAIDPAWVEELGANLLKHNYSDPVWSRKRGAAMATQRSTLYGVTIVADRSVPYHRVDPVAARDMFIRHALIEGEWSTHHHFFHDNRRKLEEAGEYEEKARRRGLVVDEDTLFDFYDQRIPASVTTARHFDSWWKKQRDKHVLDFDPDKLIEDSHEVTEEAFPDRWLKGSIDYDLAYKFEPGNPLDGVTLMVPVPLLAGLDTEGFDWLVPGLRLELVTELIRTLPKALRRTVVPAPEFAERALPRLIPYEGSLTQQLADVLREMGGHGINASDFRPSALPAHLRMNFAAVDKRGEIIDSDRDLAALVKRQAGHITSSVSKAGRKSESRAVKEWSEDTLGEIQEEVTTVVDGHEVTAYPGLVATKDGVALKVHPTKAAADASMLTTTLTLLLRQITVNKQQMIKGLPLQQRVAVDSYPHGGAEGLVNDARVAAIRDILIEMGGPVRTPAAFEALRKEIAPQVPGRVRQSVVAIAPGLVEYSNLKAELAQWEGPAIDDIQAQLDFLLPPHAITTHGMAHLRHLPRYLAAARIRLEDMNLDPNKDADRQADVEEAKAYLSNRLRTLPAGRDKTREVKEIYWMIEELRVSLFAQRLGTAHAVSLRRIQKAVDKLR